MKILFFIAKFPIVIQRYYSLSFFLSIKDNTKTCIVEIQVEIICELPIDGG